MKKTYTMSEAKKKFGVFYVRKKEYIYEALGNPVQSYGSKTYEEELEKTLDKLSKMERINILEKHFTNFPKSSLVSNFLRSIFKVKEEIQVKENNKLQLEYAKAMPLIHLEESKKVEVPFPDLEIGRVLYIVDMHDNVLNEGKINKIDYSFYELEKEIQGYILVEVSINDTSLLLGINRNISENVLSSNSSDHRVFFEYEEAKLFLNSHIMKKIEELREKIV